MAFVMWRTTDYQNTGYVDSLAATSSFPPAMFSVDFLKEALLEYLFAIIIITTMDYEGEEEMIL